MSDLEKHLVDAIWRGTLGTDVTRLAESAASPDDRRRAGTFRAACRRIGEEVAEEEARIREWLAAATIDVTPVRRTDLAQRHELRFETTREHAQLATELLERRGYSRHPRWNGGAERSFWATSHEVSLTRTASWTTVVRLRWRPPVSPGPLGNVFRPRPPDWDAIDLPPALSWLYRLVRPVRLALDRSGLRRRDQAPLEPFLATPQSLIAPLLEFGEVRATDVVADVGCGDGRIVIEAARTIGCRAIGIEQSPQLAALARESADSAGVADRVSIVDGDARNIDVGQVDVVLLFLPMVVAVRLVPNLLQRLSPGARVILHEQSPLAAGLPSPAATRALVSEDGVTVAHVWRVENTDLDGAGPTTNP